LLRVTEQIIDVDTVACIHDGGHEREVSGADCSGTRDDPNQNASKHKSQVGNLLTEQPPRITWKEKGICRCAVDGDERAVTKQRQGYSTRISGSKRRASEC
jgi:hypothetical protein